MRLGRAIGHRAAGGCRQRPTAPREFAVLAGIFGAAVGLLAFAKLAGEVLEGETRAFDRAVLLARDQHRPAAELLLPGAVWSLVAHTDSHFDPEALRRYLLAYQEVQPLTIDDKLMMSPRSNKRTFPCRPF